jgi:hypothetical protein
MGQTKIILFYNTMWGQPLSYPEADIPEGFMLTTDRHLLPEATGVVFHLPSLRLDEIIRKRQGQIWVAWWMECCEAHYPHLCRPSFLDLFELQMNYHSSADVPVPYIQHNFRELLRGSLPPKERGKLINSFISSTFNQSGRVAYLKALMDILDVHSYGRLFQNRVLDQDTGRQSKMETIAGYQFTLAFENAVFQDYVTEKFYDPLIAGSVPVYLGAPNIEAFAPGDRCFVSTSDFDTPEALARYLQLVSEDEALYQHYLEWREKPFKPSFVRLLEEQKKHPFVRLCQKVQRAIEKTGPI